MRRFAPMGIMLALVLALTACGASGGHSALPSGTPGGKEQPASPSLKASQAQAEKKAAKEEIAIKRVAYIISPSFGTRDDLAHEIVLSSDGTALLNTYFFDSEELASTQERSFPAEEFGKLATIIRENDFFSLPERIETGVLDGSFEFISVETESGVWRSGGLLPSEFDERFANIVAEVERIREGMEAARKKGGTPLFEFLNDPAITAFAQSFETDFPVSVAVLYQNVGGGEPITKDEERVIRAVFTALSKMVVMKEAGPGHTDDYLTYTFRMKDGKSVSFSFQSGMLDMDMALYEIVGYKELLKALRPPGWAP